MDDYETIEFNLDARLVATISLARPDKHNAINAQMIDELNHAVSRIKSEEGIRCCVLQARGDIFCAGGDLKWMQSQMGQSREEQMAGTRKLAQMLADFDALPCPVIGKVQGSAYGGGIGLMAICDSVICNESAKFALTETRLGLIPATIGPYVIRRMGEAWARQYFFSSKPFDADIAKAMQLVSIVAPKEALDEMLELEVSQILPCRPQAVSRAKHLVQTLSRNPTMEMQEYTANQLADCWESDEAQEAISAFFAKR